jgi:hypothetical protein
VGKDIKKTMLKRELNAHTINMTLNPPSYFSEYPTWLTLQHKLECMKLFPSRPKFSGANTEGAINIIEFLNAINSAQTYCKTSENEFKEMLLACTTGRAHGLLMERLANDDDVPTIYHILLTHFDRRISPEAARLQIADYRAPRSATLASVEAHLMSLVNRSSCMLPAGPSRIANFNLESIQALINCLPPHSSGIVRMKYNELSARLGHAATAAQLSHALYSTRHAIDKDIASFGYDSSPDSSSPLNPKEDEYEHNYAQAYAVSQDVQQVQYEPEVSVTSQPHLILRENTAAAKSLARRGARMNKNHRSQQCSQGYQSEGDWSNFPQSGNDPESQYDPHTPEIDYSGGFVPRHARYSQNYASDMRSTYPCCLSGQTDHVSTQGCPNIVDRYGDIIEIWPTEEACSACPNYNLFHPNELCPFRQGAPLEHLA